MDLALRTAYYNMREAEKRFGSTSDAVQQAEEDYYIAKEKYRAGEGLMLDIIDAQLALSTAKLNHISAQYDYARSKAEVENIMVLGLTEREQAAASRLVAVPVEVKAAKAEPKASKPEVKAESAEQVAEKLAADEVR